MKSATRTGRRRAPDTTFDEPDDDGVALASQELNEPMCPPCAIAVTLALPALEEYLRDVSDLDLRVGRAWSH
jgi:hypothetical protein